MVVSVTGRRGEKNFASSGRTPKLMSAAKTVGPRSVGHRAYPPMARELTRPRSQAATTGHIIDSRACGRKCADG